jgi:hypothetical protein
MCEDWYRAVSKSLHLARAKSVYSVKTHKQGLAVLLVVRLVGIHHAVQPWQQFPGKVNVYPGTTRAYETNLAQWSVWRTTGTP